MAEECCGIFIRLVKIVERIRNAMHEYIYTTYLYEKLVIREKFYLQSAYSSIFVYSFLVTLTHKSLEPTRQL